MINTESKLFRKRILLSIILPVFFVGLFTCIFSANFITRSILQKLKQHIDFQITHATHMALDLCETNMKYLLDLRLEDDPEMDRALKKETGEELRQLAEQFDYIEILVVDSKGNVVASSIDVGAVVPTNTYDEKSGIHDHSFLGQRIRAVHTFFPFWDWYITSYIPEQQYMAPLTRARAIIYAGSFSILITVWIVLLIVINRFINKPLARLSDATRSVAEGEFCIIENVRKDEIGQVIETFNLMVDSLSRKDKEVSDLIEALTESERRYRELFTGATEGIVVADLASGKPLYANPAMSKFLGYDDEDFQGISILDLHPKEDQPKVSSAFDKQRKGEPFIASEIPFVKKDGSLIYVDVRATPIMVGEQLCSLAFLIDATERRAASEEKKELQRRLLLSEKMEAIGMLAGGVAHDLNNILSGLVSYPELLLLDLPADSPLRGPIQTIEKSGHRAAAIVQDLLTLARRGVAVSQVTNLNDIVTEYLQSVEHESLKRHHPAEDFVVELADDLMPIMGSPIHLSKTVMNLVSNAAEAIQSTGGQIHLSTRNLYVDKALHGYNEVAEGDYAALTVSDNGIGIKDEDLKRIFEPFYSRKMMGRSGTGLGMAVVWGTVKDHNGYIDVVSRIGEGTTFTLYFPITRKTETHKADNYLTRDLMGNGQTILVVDDVEAQREIADGILSRLGYKVTTVSSGETAIEYLEQNSVDLVILDMIMEPGLDGLTTFQKILEIAPDQKAILASGFSENERVRQAQELGARQYLKKPYTLEAIGVAVKEEFQSIAG